MQTNTHTISATVNSFISPEAMLQGLIASLTSPCNCGSQEANCECEEEQLN